MFFRRKKQKECTSTTNKEHDKEHNTNSFGERLDKITEDGDLPFGWISYNREFTDAINNEFSYLLNNWIESRTSSIKDRRSALKTFILYMEDVKKLCRSKGECFEFWFDEILTGKGYLEKRKKELNYIETHYNNLVELENEKSSLSTELLKYIKNHNGILQKDIYKDFNPDLKPHIQNMLYQWDKEGTIKRIKKGNTYVIFV